MGSSPVIGEPNTSKMKILLFIGAFVAAVLADPEPVADPSAEANADPWSATTVAWDIMDMAMDSVMAMVATMVAIVPTAMAMDTMAARRGLLSLNQLLIPLLKPMLILGTPTTVD